MMTKDEAAEPLPRTRRERRERAEPAARRGARGAGRGARHATKKPPGRGVLGRLPIVALVAAGVGLLLYPATANWFADRAHAVSVSSYVGAVDETPDRERERILAEARDYNSRIGVQTLTDPYTDVAEVAATSDLYLDQLRVPGSDSMGRIRIPTIDVSLPVRHGTSDTVLSNGIGHLQGSSLPVGGESTKAVLTGHSGLPNTRLFTDLHSMEVGDMIYIDVLGETLAYRTTAIDTVLPTETDLLNIEDGEDRIVLITCTPIGINSHRLLVQAERVDLPIDAPLADGAEVETLIPFPWWAAGVGVTLIGCAAILFGPVVWNKHRSRPTTPVASDSDLAPSLL